MCMYYVCITSIVAMHAQVHVMQNHGLINYDTTFRTKVIMPLTIRNPNLHGEDCEEVQENPRHGDESKLCLSG